MDYIKNNKLAWEEAFENRRPNWGDENYKILMTGVCQVSCRI